ncbi:MAG: hypothetical protein AMXMBFR4_35400 [Candidatus Hydrogenedentota bacterium]
MYHSHLLINVGDNPDRPDWNITRRWLRNLYRVHQRLCMAFQTSSSALPDTPDAHHARNNEGGFLYRIDHTIYDVVNGKATRSGRDVQRPIIIVQSAKKPDWDFAFGLNPDVVDERHRPVGNASFLLVAPPQIREIAMDLDGDTLTLACPTNESRNFVINPGDSVRFRLRANPTWKKQDGTPNGKRCRPRVPEEAFKAGGVERDRAFVRVHEEWLQRKLGDAADSLECFHLDHEGRRLHTLVTGWAWGWRTKYEPQPDQRMQWWSVLFEGTFRVNNTGTLKKLLESGVGPAKAFGFGLLSVARIR